MMCQGSMARVLRLSLFSLLGVLYLASCASIGKPKNSSDTLLIIAVDWTVKGSSTSGVANWIWYYELQFAGIAEPVTVKPGYKHYVAVTRLPAGQHRITQISLMPIAASDYANPKIYKEKGPDVAIVTREGAATMTSFCLDTTLEETQAHWFRQGYNFRTLTVEDIERVRAELEKEGDFLAWEDALPQ